MKFKNLRMQKIISFVLVFALVITPFPFRHQKTVNAFALTDTYFLALTTTSVKVLGGAIAISALTSVELASLKESYVSYINSSQTRIDAAIASQTKYLNDIKSYASTAMTQGFSSVLGSAGLVGVGFYNIVNNLQTSINNRVGFHKKIAFTGSIVPSTYEVSKSTQSYIYLHASSYQYSFLDRYELYTTYSNNVSAAEALLYKTPASINFGTSQYSTAVAATAGVIYYVYDTTTQKFLTDTGGTNLFQVYVTATNFGISNSNYQNVSSAILGLHGTKDIKFLDYAVGKWVTVAPIVSPTTIDDANPPALPTTASVPESLPYIAEDATIDNYNYDATASGLVNSCGVAMPWAGSTAIDVPISEPSDVPIDEPLPWLENLIGATIIGDFIAWLATAFSNLKSGIVTGLSSVIDTVKTKISDLTGSLNAGVVGIVAAIGGLFAVVSTAITHFFDPPDENFNWDKLKGLSTLLFTKFPFSIPFDLYTMFATLNADPVAPRYVFEFDLSSFGADNMQAEIDLSNYENWATMFRNFMFLGFCFCMLYNTKNLMWK